MRIRRRREPLSHTTQSGLVVPAGTSSVLSVSDSQTYLQVKEKTLLVEKLYSDNKVLIPPACDLAHLISDAKRLSDAWLMGSDDATPSLLFRVTFIDRIADAILPLANVPERVRYLAILTRGTLDLHKRERSKAKDILWELELWSTLRRRSINAVLREPPDIVLDIGEASIGVACKKFYSESNVEKVLSEAVGQLEATPNYGIVAINLNDLMPPEKILVARNQVEMGEVIDGMNQDFLRRHARHFKKYLSAGRILAALVSTSVIADAREEKTRFNIASQTTIWAVPGLHPDKEKQLIRFREQLMN